MLHKTTRKGLLTLAALLLPVFTTACATAASPDKPAEFRLRPPPQTDIPRGSVPCAKSSTGWCLSDAENADLLIRYEKGERERDRKLCWLLKYFGYEACEVE